jgi:AcrR family transcriptional regulator
MMNKARQRAERSSQVVNDGWSDYQREPTHNLCGQRLGRKGQHTKERIITAMLNVRAVDDKAPLTLSAVAREASVSISNLYLYFPDMGDLLLAALRRVFDQNEPAFMVVLRHHWPDEQLHEWTERFVRSQLDFWRRHARLLYMRNSLADAADPRLLGYRQRASRPVIALILDQMQVPDEQARTHYHYVASILFTGLERVASVIVNPSFAVLAGVPDTDDLTYYVEQLILAEARVIEGVIRDMRSARRRPA